MDTQKLHETYCEWLDTYKWQWFATLTFRGAPSSSKADRLFRKWIDEVERAVGTASFCWFRVAEHGAYGDNLHFHALIGGLREPSKWDWLFRWEELAGEAQISYFVAFGGATSYILKSLRPDVDFDAEFHLP